MSAPLTTAEAADLLKVNVQRVRLLIADGRIKATMTRIGKAWGWTIERADLEAYKPKPRGRPRKQ